MRSVGAIVVVLVVCGIGVLYIMQHTCSLKLAQRIGDLEHEREMLVQQLDSVEVDIVRLSSFVRLEALWVAQGRLPRPTVPTAAPTGAVAARAGAGSGI
ncbi:MAG: hypothetical protein R6X13_11315 [bacterium]